MENPFSLIGEDLQRVEALLRDDAVSEVEAITEIGRHLQQSGGKRMRPALVLLAARLCDCSGPSAVRLAAVVEMIHAATLIHDDVIDEADTRRGQVSTNARWGNSKCVLAGDWLYMQAFRLALRERSFAVLDALIALTQTMVEGELLQLQRVARVVSPAEHLDLIERKTARLFRLSAQLGALAGERDADTVDRLGRFGHHLGLAFQMTDDMLDYTGSEQSLGKPVGNDLREGKMTLPAIYAYESASPEDRAKFERVMRDRGYVSVPFAEIQALVTHNGALARARAESCEQAGLALAAVREFPASPWREAMERLPEMVIDRSR